ncbi:hypothetical protein Ahy_B09g096010 isoform A [Arachis hypogaea]|uniref:Transposase MuDR plant domain-containing protein n=1 Tax=Arachis hypogaea TaxID=3818 RepID=A0A444XIE3_ARAHY|nr:hypothetical protein Ahy_B09g096010 isoform A [Arachis hypogaea]
MMFSYHRSIGSIYSLELCVNLQDISGSSSSSNNVEGIRNLGSEDFVLGRDIGRARSPTLNAFVTPEPNTDNCHARPFASNLVAFEGGHHDGMAETSDEDEIKDFSSDEAEVVSETQPLYRETVRPIHVESGGGTGAGGVSSSTLAHYLSLNLGAMNLITTEDRPSNYALSGEMELEIGLKFFNRETAMLAVKNYNIRRSAEYKLVESDQSSCKDQVFQILENLKIPRAS